LNIGAPDASYCPKTSRPPPGSSKTHSAVSGTSRLSFTAYFPPIAQSEVGASTPQAQRSASK